MPRDDFSGRNQAASREASRLSVLIHGMPPIHGGAQQVLRDELVKYSDLARDLRYGVTLHRRRVNQSEFISIARQAMSQARGYGETLMQLFEEPLRDAIGLPGIPGDPQAICYIGARMADVYRAVLEWGLSWHGLECDWPESHGVIALMPECIGSIATAIERLPGDIEAQVRAARDYQGDTPMMFRVTLTLEIPEHIQMRMRHELRRMTGVTGATRKPRVRKRWVLLALIAIVYLMRFCGK